jgi:hypothetical protein
LTEIGSTDSKSDRTRLAQKSHEEPEKRLRSGRFGHYTAVDGRYVTVLEKWRHEPFEQDGGGFAAQFSRSGQYR